MAAAVMRRSSRSARSAGEKRSRSAARIRCVRFSQRHGVGVGGQRPIGHEGRPRVLVLASERVRRWAVRDPRAELVEVDDIDSSSTVW